MSSAASNPTDGTNKPIMLKRNSDDIGWDYGVLVDPANLNIIKCKLCGLQVTSGIYRLKLHIAGIRGQVRPCPKSSPEDKEKCKKAIDDSKDAKKARQDQQQEVRDAVDLAGAPNTDEDTTMTEVEELDGPGGKPVRKIGPMDKFTLPLDQASLSTSAMRQKLISETVWKDRLHTLQRYIAKWVYVHGVSFNMINNIEFDQVLEAAGRFGPGGKKPNQHQLRESLLFEEVNDTKKMMKAHEEEWAKNGCSVMTDAWTDQKRRSIMNICVHSSIGSSFLESKEVSEESHTGHFIFEFVDHCIERIGAENVVQVCTDNASNNMAAKDLLFVKRPKIFWSSCATHTLNLMLEGVGKMKRFKGCIDQAKSLTVFIYSHHKTLALMRKFTKKRDIVRPGVTRFASAFLTLQSLYEKKEQLRAMSQCDEWDKFLGLSHIKKNSKGVLATATMTKPAFWSNVALCLRVFEPLVKVLRMVDSDIKPSMAFLYGDIVNAKKEIKKAFGNIDKPGNLSGSAYNNVIEIIENKMKDRLDSPLHLAAYFLNPYYSYSDDSIFKNEQIMDGLMTAVETFYHGDYDKQNKVLNEELPKFRDKEGHFGKPVAKDGCKDYNFDPAKWWGSYGTQVPTLQRMAIRILSLTSSASGCERTWSCFEGNHTKKRNKLTSERLNQLVFVQYNNKMNGKKVKTKKNQNMDPLLGTDSNRAQGWLVDGGDEEDGEPVCGLTWKLIEEACGVEECGKLRRSARLAQMRDVSEDEFESEEEPTNEEDIDFESDQEDVVPVVGEDEQDGRMRTSPFTAHAWLLILFCFRL